MPIIGLYQPKISVECGNAGVISDIFYAPPLRNSRSYGSATGHGLSPVCHLNTRVKNINSFKPGCISGLYCRGGLILTTNMKLVLFPIDNQTHFVTLVELLLFCECWIFYGLLRLQHDYEVGKVGQLNQEI